MNASLPLTFPDLHAQARSLEAAGGTTSLPAATIPGAVSDLRAALAQQVSAALALGSDREALVLVDPVEGTTVAPLDIRTYLPGTAGAAQLRAANAGHRKPANARRRVERLLEALTGCAPRSANGRHVAVLPPGWETVIESARAAGDVALTSLAQRRWRNVATGLRGLAALAVARGMIDPWALPAEYEALCALLRQWGVRSVPQAVWTLRQGAEAVRAHAASSPLPTWERLTPSAALLVRLKAALPLFMAGLDAWQRRAHLDTKTGRDPNSRTQTAHTALRPSTVVRYHFQTVQWAAGLLALHERGALPGIQLETLTLEDVWTMRVPREAQATPVDDADLAALNARYGQGTPDEGAAPVPAEEVPLAIRVAELAVDAGDIWRRARHVNGGDLPPSVLQMLYALFSVAERVAIVRTGSDSTQAVRELRASWRQEQAALKDGLRRSSGQRKDATALLRMVTLPQLVCAILPYLTLVHLRGLRRSAKATAQRAASAGASAAAGTDALRAAKAFRGALQDWVVLATFTADPARGGNLRHARLGREVQLDATWSSDGALEKVTALRATFSAHGESDVWQVETKNDAARSWTWMPSILSPTWAAVYLREFWLATLLERGLVPAGTTLREAVASGRFAWFLNDDERGGHAAVEGAYSASESVSDCFARALLTGLAAAGRHVPPTVAACRRRWPWLLSPHIIRTLWSTYWLGIRGSLGPARGRGAGRTGEDRQSGVDIACWATGDTEATLRTNYTVVEDTMKDLFRSPTKSFEHPAVFDDVMDMMWWGERIDWQARFGAATYPIPEPMRLAFKTIEAGRDTVRRPPTRRRGRRPAPARA